MIVATDLTCKDDLWWVLQTRRSLISCRRSQWFRRVAARLLQYVLMIISRWSLCLLRSVVAHITCSSDQQPLITLFIPISSHSFHLFVILAALSLLRSVVAHLTCSSNQQILISLFTLISSRSSHWFRFSSSVEPFEFAHLIRSSDQLISYKLLNFSRWRWSHWFCSSLVAADLRCVDYADLSKHWSSFRTSEKLLQFLFKNPDIFVKIIPWTCLELSLKVRQAKTAYEQTNVSNVWKFAKILALIKDFWDSVETSWSLSG